MAISITDISQILITLITTFGAVYCARLEKKNTNNPTPPTGNGSNSIKLHRNLVLGMWVCIVIAIVNSGLMGWRLLGQNSTTDVTIEYPIDQALVDQTITVRGTSQALTTDQVIWMVVFVYQVGRYYPQNEPVEMEADNNWSSVVYVGGPNDAGMKFDVIALVADPITQNEFNLYLAEAKGKNDWAGLSSLPEGAVIYDRITVNRK